MTRHFFQADEVCIVFKHNGNIEVSTSIESFAVSTEGKQVFENGFGETVIELSGLTSEDVRSDRSWALASYKKGGCSQLHYHEKGTEHYYITKGSAKVVVDGREHLLLVGETIMINPGQHHRVESVGVEDLEMIVCCSPAWVVEDQYF